MPTRTVKEWFELFLRMQNPTSHQAAFHVLTYILPWQERTQGRTDAIANAMTAFRMMPITSHNDPHEQPWYRDLPQASAAFNTEEGK